MASETDAFSIARAATDRGAFERYKKTQEIDSSSDPVAVRTVEERFHSLPLLLAPELRSLSLRALEDARGKRVDENEKFHCTIWTGGATDTYGGRRFLGSIADFARVLSERARVVKLKNTGWVVEPTTNTDGHRCNASTTAVHALFLDCDGAGSWDHLLETLTSLDFALIAYESGGHAPPVHKWRVVLPLSQPFETIHEIQQTTWKTIYHHTRVVVGSVAGLLGAGFDSSTDTPCHSWYVTERRDAGAPLRRVVWRAGRTLDLVALALALPHVELEDRPRSSGIAVAASEPLSDSRLEEIVSALCAPMSRITHTRRDLYLALAGVMCDRGVADDTVEIVEEVSRRCPGEQDRHREHVHCARTTVAKWESGGFYTRIGTLHDRWPEVAAALDSVLPNDNLTAEDVLSVDEQVVGIPRSQKPTDPKKARRTLLRLRQKKFGKSRRARKFSAATDTPMSAKECRNTVDTLLLSRMLDREPLAPPTGPDEVTGLDRLTSIQRLAGLLAFSLPNADIDTIVELIAGPSILKMCRDDEPRNSLVEAMKNAYRRARERRA